MTKNHETCLTISNRDTVKDLIAYFDWLFRFNPSDQWDFADLGKKLDRFFAQRESL
jgi:hypothetical protein